MRKHLVSHVRVTGTGPPGDSLFMIRDLGIAEESYEMAREFCKRANEAISVLPDGADRGTLAELTEYILERRS